MDSAVDRAAAYIWTHYHQPLTLADIARSATLSRFHLGRKFQAATGVSPGRFLAAVRVYQAKSLLLRTGVGVTDIAYAVGYNSVGSFTSYFTASVGVPPGQFREQARNRQLGFPRPARDPAAPGAVHGTIRLPAGSPGARVYLGAFSTALVQRQPADAVVVDVPAGGQPASYRLRCVPRGKWYIHAVGLDRAALVAGRGPVPVRTSTSVPLSLRPRRAADPPVLLALPGLEAGTQRPLPGAPNSVNRRAQCGRS